MQRHGEEDLKAANQATLRQGIAGHYARLLRIVRSRGVNQDDAADIVQDAYARLTVAAERTEVHNPGAFLHVTAINLIRDRGRASISRGLSAANEAPPEDIACPAPSAERLIIGRQNIEVLERALGELPPKRRAALVLYRFDNMSHAAIAEQLGISISMVEKHVRLALEHCRLRLRQAGDVIDE
ncbi:RNA polymerase sigma-70 factor, ECF subfamily [Sphingomonas laterariae]|uniref:RNA polymerase sigma-70 factor, ECF subfamily n=1 Tax=Edaphosphingomonas laterariae TaxID=861865 RepID=A0A239KIC6_9SPHN|nr:sigma-70 family RNA polymerase sigma factor [Sphingomonas laterariae]SNT17760.1 RNA polymerase sigma-70 factor, ECF subfamily [Sphingomonas laterariae]